jgi:hypothetical protein
MKLTRLHLTLLLIFCVAPVILAATTYTFTNVDFPGAVQSNPNGLNDSGRIVGEYYDSSGALHGYLWSAGTFTSIDFPGAVWTRALGINNTGQIVGVYYTCAASYGCHHSYLYSGGVFTALPEAPGSKFGTTAASTINASGQIAGYYVDPCFCKAHGFLLSGGVYSTIDDPGFFSTGVQGMTDSAQMVGVAEQCWGGCPAYPFLWSGGVFTAIVFPPPADAYNAIPTAINNAGDVAGYYFLNGQSLGFVLSKGVLTSIVDPAAANGYTWINGPGLNSTGQVAGAYLDSANYVHGFLASPAAVATIQPPIDADGSSVFKASRGVVPVKFTLTLNGVSTCDLPPATISLFRTSGASPGPVNEDTFIVSSDSGSNFRITGCQYVFNLGAKLLGSGTYLVQITISNEVVGSGTFGLN